MKIERKMIPVYVTQEEKKAIEKNSDSYNLAVSTYLRKVGAVMPKKKELQQIVKNKELPDGLRELVYEMLKAIR